MIIDWEHHYQPFEVFKKRGGKPGERTLIMKEGKVDLFLYDASWNIDLHLDFMDRAGIDMAVLTGGGMVSPEELRSYDDSVAQVCRQHPGRFVALCPVSPLRVKECLAELDRALSHLGFKGIIINAQPGATLDDRRLWPFYEAVAKRDLPVFIHVSTSPPGFSALDAPYDLNRSLAREFDSCAAACRFILGGALEDFPNLKMVFAHFGGGIAAVRDRMERYVRFWGEKFWQSGKPNISKPFSYYLGKLYFDMAGYEGGMNAVHCALTCLKPEQLVFATDYPPNFVDDPQGARRYVENLRALPLPKADIEGMLGGNAARLLKL